MSSSPCAACKFLRRKCTPECVFSAYFPADNPKRFADVHKVFGASNVAKILQDMDPAHREDAVESLAYEADARITDPVYGCVGTISQMQQRLSNLHASLEESKKQLASMVGPAAMFQMLHDSMLRAQFTPVLASAASSSALLGMDRHQQYKFQQEQYQIQQQQIGAHIMQQWLQQSERQQQLVQQGGGGGGGGQLVIRERQQLPKEQLQIQVRDEQHKQQLHGHGGAMVIRDATANLRQIDTQEAATLQAREEQDMFTMSYEEMHRQAQMVVLRKQQEAELMNLHQHIEARGGAGPSRTTADLSPLLALDGGGFHSMNLYPVQQQQQQPLSMLQQAQHQPEELLQQEQQQEIQDIQLFPDHNLHPPDP